VEERVQAVSVGIRAEARRAGRCGNVTDGVFRLRRVRCRLEPGNQGVGAMGRDKQKLQEQGLVK